MLQQAAARHDGLLGRASTMARPHSWTRCRPAMGGRQNGMRPWRMHPKHVLEHEGRHHEETVLEEERGRDDANGTESTSKEVLDLTTARLSSSLANGTARLVRRGVIPQRGPELAITYLNDKARPFVEPLARSCRAIFIRAMFPYTRTARAVFEAIRTRWGALDVLFHALLGAQGGSARPLVDCSPMASPSHGNSCIPSFAWKAPEPHGKGGI